MYGAAEGSLTFLYIHEQSYLTVTGMERGEETGVGGNALTH